MKGNRQSAPCISVLMTVHNREAFLAEAIESILEQTFTDFEFLILDSSSMKEVTQIIRDYARKDRRIHCYFLEVHDSPVKMNFGVHQASGKWIARMDSDDISLPSRLQTQLEWMNATGVDVCGCYYENFGDKENIIWCPESHEVICREMLFRVAILNGAIMMRTETIKYNPYDENVLLDDYEWPVRMTSKARLGNVPQVLVKRRCHPQQASRIEISQITKEFHKYRFRYFYARYPDTPLPDFLALARVVDQQPLTTLSELRRAGRWLVDLARQPDPLLRQTMARRWHKTWERSQHLGATGQAIFNEYREQFDLVTDLDLPPGASGHHRIARQDYEKVPI